MEREVEKSVSESSERKYNKGIKQVTLQAVQAPLAFVSSLVTPPGEANSNFPSINYNFCLALLQANP